MNRRARILDLLHRKEHPATIHKLLQVGIATVYNTQKRFLESGFQAALSERPRSGKPPTIKPAERAKINRSGVCGGTGGLCAVDFALVSRHSGRVGLLGIHLAYGSGRILKKLFATAQTKVMVYRANNG